MDIETYFQRLSRNTGLMNRMMDRVGVDKAGVSVIDGGMALSAAQTKCVFCSSPETCSRWLDGDEGPQNPANFCPNSSFFSEYAAAPSQTGRAQMGRTQTGS